MKRLLLIGALLALVPVLVLGATSAAKRPIPTYPLTNGMEENSAPVVMPPYLELPGLDAVDLLGDTTTIGTTWYDNQHNGTIGRMVEKSSDGYLHLVWMNGLNSGASNRHIYYNAISPAGAQVWPQTGYPVESAYRGGFTVVDADFGGIALPAFHQMTTSTATNKTAIGADFGPHMGAFIVSETLPITGVGPLIWPKMMVGLNGRLNVMSTENVATAGAPQKQYFISGTYNAGTSTITYDPAWTLAPSTMTIAADVASSTVSNKMAYAWTYCRDAGFPGGTSFSQRNNDIWLLIDADGLNPDFNQAVNITNFIPPDLQYLPDTTRADMDTLRAYTDLNVFIDQNDYVHLTFTTPSFFELEGTTYWHPSIIWHWSNQYNEFKIVHNAFDDWNWNFVNCGAWNVKAQRPSLGQNPANGYLYCMYQVYDVDTTHLSLAGWPSGEVYVSVSTDGGQSWAVGTNVTSTITPNHATAGNCRSELTPSMAKVVDGYCHITYVYDRDAGNISQTEGAWTLNPVKYHKVPVGLIPTTPLVPQNVPFHVSVSYPNVTITMTPVGPPPVIPPTGGSFDYNASVHNGETASQAFDAWIMVKLPTGPMYGPVLGPVTLTLPASGTLTRVRTQSVPGSAPPGLYYYIGYVGDYPGAKWDSSYFNFTKNAVGAGGPLVGEWSNTGESFESGTATTPASFDLINIHPNPFNPSTTISFSLPEAAYVELAVYDLSGRQVAKLVEGMQSAGSHSAIFDGSGLSSGIYLYRLSSAGITANGKMLLVK